MHEGDDIEAKVIAAMSSLENIRSAQPKSFFYTRVHSKLEKRGKVWNKVFSLVCKPSIAIGIITLVISIDVVTLLLIEESSSPLPEFYVSSQYPEFAQSGEEFYDYEYEDDIMP